VILQRAAGALMSVPFQVMLRRRGESIYRPNGRLRLTAIPHEGCEIDAPAEGGSVRVRVVSAEMPATDADLRVGVLQLEEI